MPIAQLASASVAFASSSGTTSTRMIAPHSAGGNLSSGLALAHALGSPSFVSDSRSASE